MPNQNVVPSPFKSPEIPKPKKKSNSKKQASPIQMNVTYVESDVSFTEEEDDDVDNDPDWKKTPIFRRLQTIRVKDFLQISSSFI